MKRERKADIAFVATGMFVGLLFVWPHPAPVGAPVEMRETVEWRHRENLERAAMLGTPDEQVFYIAMVRAGWQGSRREIVDFGYSLCTLFDKGDPVEAAYPDVFMMAALSDAAETVCREDSR